MHLAKISASIVTMSTDEPSSVDGANTAWESTETLDKYQPEIEIDLTTDAPVSVQFNGMTAALVRVIATGGKVRARLTSADGSAQALPVDPFLQLISRSVPFTALDLTRVTGAPTVRVRVALGAPAT